MSLLLRDAVGIHARVRSSSGVRAPLAPAPRESWGTVRSHEPRRGTPLWGEGNRPQKAGGPWRWGPGGWQGATPLRSNGPELPRHGPPPAAVRGTQGRLRCPLGRWKAPGSPSRSSGLVGIQPPCGD